MLFSLLATRAVTRSLVASPLFVSRRVQLSQITRSFSVSRVSWAPAARVTAKSAPKKAAVKKPVAKKTAKKTAAKKTKTKVKAKRAVKKPAKPKKKVKKAPARIVVKAENKPPKRPGNAYTLFLQKHTAGTQKVEGETPIERCQRISKDAAASWAALSDEEKQPFGDESAAVSEEYRQKLAAYIKNTDRAILREVNRRLAKRGRNTIKIRSGLTNGFIQFLREQRQITPVSGGLPGNQEFVKAQGVKWIALSDAEKQVYKDRAATINASKKN